MTPSRPPTLLLVEADPALAELDRFILGDEGYLVREPRDDADPVDEAEALKPDVIVVNVGRYQRYGVELLDRLHANVKTRAIPVVAVSTSRETAGEAKASPNVPDTLVLPYDIEDLVRAVADAVKKPTPSSRLPPTRHPVPEYVTAVADDIVGLERAIAVRVLRQLLQVEGYRSRFPELTDGLADNLGRMLGVVVAALRRGTPPDEVFAIPDVQEAIREHVQLRTSQGLGPAGAIREYQILRDQVERHLHEMVVGGSLSGADALDVSRRFNPYFDELIRGVITEYHQSNDGGARSGSG